MAASITRFGDGDGDGDGDGAAPLPSVVGDFEVTGSRPIGAPWLLDGL